PDAPVAPFCSVLRRRLAVFIVCPYTTLFRSPALVVTEALVPAVSGVPLVSVAVTVQLPAVFRVTLNVFVPLTSAALAGSAALASPEENATVLVSGLKTLQFASIAINDTFTAV